MFHNKNILLIILGIVLLAGGSFGLAVGKPVQAAPVKNPAQESVGTNSPTPTPTLPLASSRISAAKHTKTPTKTPTNTPTGTLPTSTDTPTRTRTRTPTITTLHHIVISEFRTTGPLGAYDEFIELYNPTGASINIGYWYISVSSACGTSKSTLAYIPYGTILKPGQHYLLAANLSYSSITNADQRFSPGIADTGGLALIVYSDGSVEDEVGMCKDTSYFEGTPLPAFTATPTTGTGTPTPVSTFHSYERKLGGDTNTSCYDTQNNNKDFNLIAPARPHSYYTPSVMCAGVVTSSPTPYYSPTPTFTRTPTRVPTAIPASVVINEFLPHPRSDWNGDGIANVGDEYIEIMNVSPNTINVKGWKLDFGSDPYTLPDMTLQPRQIAALFQSQTGIHLSDGGGTVQLLNGRIVDAHTYPVVEIADRTWCRLPDGTAAWGYICYPTPGRPNTNQMPESSSGSICVQGSSAPDWLIIGECGNFVSKISSSLEEGSFWLKNRWKWDIFLE